jgi:hypothetical protein
MPDQTIQAVVTAAQSSIKTAVSKIQNAPPYAVDGPISIPTSLAYATNIKMSTVSSGFKLTWFDLVINIMVPVGNMESAMNWLSDIPQSVGNVFRNDPTIAGTCQTYAADITGEMVIDGGRNAVGYTLTIGQVKIAG